MLLAGQFLLNVHAHPTRIDSLQNRHLLNGHLNHGILGSHHHRPHIRPPIVPGIGAVPGAFPGISHGILPSHIG